MATPITEYDLEGMEGPASPEQRERDAQTIEQWLTETDRFELVPPLTRARVMCAIAEQYAGAGRHEDAVAWYRRAVEDGGACSPDARAALVAELLVTGQADAAAELADELRRAGLPDGASYEFVAEAFEELGDPRVALRWFSMGITAIERGRAEEAGSHGTLLVGRLRVREALGLPEDQLDAEALEYLSALRSGWD